MPDIVQKPWGTYEVLYEEPGVKVKRIVVFTGKRTSLQRHKHRKEMWSIVSGIGIGEFGYKEETYEDELTKGDMYFVDKNDWHRIHNTGTENLVFIEVQSGDILDENDIQRKEDDYGRC